MVTVRFTSASPAIGTDLFENVDVKAYTKGNKSRKVAWIAVSGSTLGTGKMDLKYGADMIFAGVACTNATIDAYDYTEDIQPVVDKRWCGPSQEMSLVVTEAPGATISVIVGIIERLK